MDVLTLLQAAVRPDHGLPLFLRPADHRSGFLHCHPAIHVGQNRQRGL